MYRVGLSSCGFELNEINFERLNKAGICAIELSRPSEWHRTINYKELKMLSKKYNIQLWSYHLPFGPLREIDISSTNKELREYTIGYFSELIKKAGDIGIDKVVIHPSGEPINDDERGEKLKCSMDSLNRLAEMAFTEGVTIAVEDLPRTCLGNTAAELAEIISVNDKLKVCFDTNHLLKDNNINFMRTLGDKIITVHISDYDFINERHWLPGEGKVDWKEFMTEFNQIGYDGVWMYEVGLVCPSTIVRARELIFDDFYENAKSIF